MNSSIQNNPCSEKRADRKKLSLRELTLFAMLGTLMYCSKIIMAILPNIHLLGMFIMTYTVVFRKKALIPLYIYILLDGLFGGFAPWWVPYLYVWTVLWGVTMLLPANLPRKKAAIIYPAVCCAHGLLFGTLYAPVQALIYGFNFKQMGAWILSGLPWDLMHGAGNLVTGMLILPLSEVLRKLNQGFLKK